MKYTLRFGPVFARFDQFMSGLGVTVGLSALVIVLGTLLGVAGAMAMGSRHLWLRRAVGVYVEIIRNTPLLAQLLLFFFGFPSLGIRLSGFVAALIALTLNMGAYTTEIVRGGIDAVPKGQTEAGLALGLGKSDIFFFIVLKQAVKIMFPALASQCTLLILASSLVSQVGVPDLFRRATQIDLDTYLSLEVYLVTSAIYLVVAVAFRILCAVGYRLIFAEREPKALTTLVAPP